MSEKEGSYEQVSRRDESTKNGLLSLFGAICEAVCGVDPTDSDASPSPDSALTKFDHDSWADFQSWRISSMIVYQTTFLALLAYFIVSAYIEGRTSSFISLDKKAGVCRSEPSQNFCCEVPQTITGTFLADAKGNWNTQNNFSYINSNYAVTVSGLEYTNEQWTDVMKNITAQLKTVGTKGANRDLAWNMVAWSSFTAQNLDRGFLQFYATGLASVMFDKPVWGVGVASALSQNNTCNQEIDVSYSASNTNMDISITLCGTDSTPCVNPCKGVLAPQAMGYDISGGRTNLEISLNMQAVSTALAVNLGMVALNHLVMIPEDTARLSLLNEMVNQGGISKEIATHTSSYFDQRQAPATPIYCYSTNAPEANSNTWESGDAFCLVRIGNTLAYPVTTSYGYSPGSSSYPTPCTQKAVKVGGSAANYYCNKYDINIGLIYYPVENINQSFPYTWAPTKTPTSRPTPLPGNPTITPTAMPTRRPTRQPTLDPTPPPGAPSVVPTRSPTARPSKRPSAAPTTYSPTTHPTTQPSSPSSRPSAPPTLLTNPTPAPTDTPTAEPTDTLNDDTDNTDDNNIGYTYIDDYTYYASPEYGGSSTDDDGFTPLIPLAVDNGDIFRFGMVAAAALSKSKDGDLFVSNNAYYAMSDTLNGLPESNDPAYKEHNYNKDFKKLCSSSVDTTINPGCAILALNIYGGDDRSISNYFYQPSSTPAYANTIYIQSELIKLQNRAPASLIQTYYSCVLAPWPALFNAVGVGFSSATVFIIVGFAVYTFMILFIMNRYFGANIPSKKAMAKAEAAEAELLAQEIQRMRAVMEAMREDLSSGKGNMPRVAEVFRTTDADMELAQYNSVKASGRRQPSSPVPDVEMRAVHSDV